MTVAEGQGAAQLDALLSWLGPLLSPRKARLFSVACSRRPPEALRTGPAGEAIEAGERFADGELTREELAPAWERALGDAARRPNTPVGLACALVAHPRQVRPGLIAGLLGSIDWPSHWRPIALACQEIILAELYALPNGAIGVGNWLGRVWGGLTDGTAGYHRAKLAQELAERDRADALSIVLEEHLRRSGDPLAPLLLEIIRVPSRPVSLDRTRLTPTILSLALAAYRERGVPKGTLDRARLVVLADALDEGGCCDEALLDHLRGPGPHVRGCWALDLVLGKS